MQNTQSESGTMTTRSPLATKEEVKQMERFAQMASVKIAARNCGFELRLVELVDRTWVLIPMFPAED